jgi:hypothetical protein
MLGHESATAGRGIRAEDGERACVDDGHETPEAPRAGQGFVLCNIGACRGAARRVAGKPSYSVGGVPPVEVGHIATRSARSDEKHLDLSRSSNRMLVVFAVVRKTGAQDPAYRTASPY